MQGYYDHHPLVTLDRHFVVASYLGAETRQIGYQLAALTGLGVSDLDRTIEHQAGRSIHALVRQDGEGRYRRLEQRMLSRLLNARPASIITLGDGTLIDVDNRRQVLEQSDLVVLDLDLANCYWRLLSKTPHERDDWHALYPGSIVSWEQIRPFHALRQPGFVEAHHRIDLCGMARSEAVKQLMGILEQPQASSPRKNDSWA